MSDTCPWKIRPFSDDRELTCEKPSGHRVSAYISDNTHQATPRDYAHGGSETTLTWRHDDRRNFTGPWFPCQDPGCVLPSSHRGSHWHDDGPGQWRMTLGRAGAVAPTLILPDVDLARPLPPGYTMDRLFAGHLEGHGVVRHLVVADDGVRDHRQQPVPGPSGCGLDPARFIHRETP